MKQFAQILFIFICLSLAAPSHAQKKDDSRYLVGAVPEIDGKIVFTKEFSIPGMSKDEIFNRINQWMEAFLKKNENTSRIVFSDKEKGQIVGAGEEWIVFSSGALSLDRTEIKYQLSATCLPQKCLLELSRIRYEYREGKEKYVAEEWISDEYALNKDKTKLIRGLAKWRKKTVDFVDNLSLAAAEALSAVETEKNLVETPAPTTVASGPIVISTKKPVAVKNVEQKVIEVKTGEETTESPASKNATYKEVAPEQLSTSLIQMGAGTLVIVIKTDAFNMTMLTANAGGSLGKMSGKPVIFTYLSPDQAYESMEKVQNYTVHFYPTGKLEPSVVLECQKMPSQAPLEGQPRMYVGQIIKATVK